MKKQLVLTSVMSLALALTACGGGSGSDNTGAPSVNQASSQNFYSFDYDYKESSNSYDIKGRKFTINNGLISQEEDALENYALTSSALYNPGYKFIGTSQANSLTSWTVYELPGIGAKVTLESVNITGKNVYDTIFPGYKDYLNYLFDGSVNSRDYQYFAKAYNLGRTNPNEKFVTGSSCLKVQKIVPLLNSFYFSFDASPSSKIGLTYDQQLANINDLKKLETQDVKVEITNGTWAGYRWIRLKTDYKSNPEYNTDIGFVEFNGQLYRSEIENAEPLDLSNYLVQAKKILEEADNEDDRANLNLIIAGLESDCSFYNETAATQIVKYTR